MRMLEISPGATREGGGRQGGGGRHTSSLVFIPARPGLSREPSVWQVHRLDWSKFPPGDLLGRE